MSKRLADITRTGIDAALQLLPGFLDSPRARIMLCAIALQESKAVHRYQVLNTPGVKGPARGLWQFEQNGGVKGVMRHPQTRDHAAALCTARDVTFDRSHVWERLEFDDVLAAGFARLLLLAHPAVLPSPADIDRAWGYYVAQWGPGKPHPKEWPANHAEAVAYVTQSGAM